MSRGSITVDAGAEKALRKGGSLLPVGVTECKGKFSRGDTVRVINAEGGEVARGLVNYSAAELSRIYGKKTREILAILGRGL